MKSLKRSGEKKQAASGGSESSLRSQGSSNEAALAAAGLDQQNGEQKGSWLSKAWNGAKNFGSEMGKGAKHGALNGAGIGAMPGLALGGALGGGLGALGGQASMVKGAAVGGGLFALPGALIGGLVGAVAGVATRGVDQLTTDENALLAETADIPSYHIILEQLAHNYAYGRGDIKTLEGWGYEISSEHVDKNSGYRVVGFRPMSPSATDPDGRALRPVVAFRGTANAGGQADDANGQGVGTFQLSRNEKETEQVFASTGGTADVTGHSLGGALAQLAAARFGSLVGDIVTFQSPGINGADAMRIDTEQHRATHYRTGGDLVSDAGEAFAVGEVFNFEHKGVNSPLSHLSFPLAELNALRKSHDMRTPIVDGARAGGDDQWVHEEGAESHDGHWKHHQVQTTSRLKAVEHSADAQDAPTTALTQVMGLGKGRAFAEAGRRTAGELTGIGDRQNGYAAAWSAIRAVVRNVTRPADIPPARARVVHLCIEHGVEPKDHAKFISQAEAAMLTALEQSPLCTAPVPG